MTDGDKIAAAILVAKGSDASTDTQSLLALWDDVLDKMVKKREIKKKTAANRNK